MTDLSFRKPKSCLSWSVFITEGSNRSSAGKNPDDSYIPLSTGAVCRYWRKAEASSLLGANDVMNSGCELNWIRPAREPVPFVGVVQIPRSGPSAFWKLVRLLEMHMALFLARNMFCESW